jgi:hypothetical protein
MGNDMESTIPAWIAAGCSLVGAFGIAWWNGRFTGSVNSRLQAIEEAVHGLHASSCRVHKRLDSLPCGQHGAEITALEDRTKRVEVQTDKLRN